ncbi:MAG TPA: DUF2087 domain-containing protein [Symbiobacteriaceae bacterium]|nr:DUF2087 domain-containing protein [Symbiobacteriaceae bacterium]
MIDADWIANSSLEQLQAGYAEDETYFTCLCCGKQFAKGVIYPEDGVLYEAWKYTRRHIEQEHQSVFDHLVKLDKSVTGLSDIQRRLLELFYQGKSDAEVQKALGIGSTSTIRNHRFALKEKERQAKVFLAIMALLRNGAPGPTTAHAPEPDAAALAKYFPAGGPLKRYPLKEKPRRAVLAAIAERFAPEHRYTEPEVNQILEAVHADYVTLRRDLVDYGFLQRLPDGSQYWRTAAPQEEPHMDRKQELKRLAKETKTEAGVYLIRNTKNGKVLVEATRNLKTINGRIFSLQSGGFPHKALQQEWNEFGEEAFEFAVLEVLEKPETGYFDEKDALKKLEAKWLDQLQPYGERGYHTK